MRHPDHWRHRLETRIAALFLALLLLVQMAGFIPVHRTIDANAHASIRAELQVRARVFELVRTARIRNLARETRVLAQDFGLFEAIASHDRATIDDALRNAGDRIDARETLLVDANGVLVAATSPQAMRFVSLLSSTAGQHAGQPSSTIGLLDAQPYLLVQAPVNAPVNSNHVIGRVVMAFRVDELLDEVRQATALDQTRRGGALDAALVEQDPGSGWTVLQAYGSLAGQDSSLAAQLRQARSDGDGTLALTIEGSEYAGRVIPLSSDGARYQQLALVLVGSVAGAAAPYRELEHALLLLTLAGILVFAIGGVLTARRIADPIRALSRAAIGLAQGDYETPVSVSGPSEIRRLARGFDDMRLAVRSREDSIRHLAYWDTLTDLPNRTQFVALLGAALSDGSREAGQALLGAAVAACDRPPSSASRCAVLMLDLDRFKQVNDVLGQAVGDRVLQQVAQRLATLCLETGETLARLGGDEFAILIPAGDAALAAARGSRILKTFEAPFVLDDQTVDLGASIGMALHPADGQTVNELLAHAEIAMYAAKHGRAGALRYDPTLDTSSEASLSLLSQLRLAVADNQLRLFLQPKVRVGDGQATGVEALVRWQHPQRGLVPPMEFIPFAEQTGFIRSITAWMIERGVAWLGQEAVRRAGLRLSLNLSVRDLLDHDLAARVARHLQRHGVRPDRLGLEITESAIMDDPQRAQATLEQLHQLGVWLSIDDYGTGYSSLAYLKRLRVDELKIDKSFVMAMAGNDDDAKIVRSTIELGHNLGLSVVAEGVETEGAWRLLAQWGCDDAQGYLMGKPMPAEDFDAWNATFSRQASAAMVPLLPA